MIIIHLVLIYNSSKNEILIKLHKLKNNESSEVNLLNYLYE